VLSELDSRALRKNPMKWILTLGCLLALAGCKKEEAPAAAASAVPSAPPAVSIAPLPTAAPSASAEPSASAGAAPTTAAAAAEEPKKAAIPSGSVQACCNALSAASANPKSGHAKNKYASAATTCAALEQAIKTGKATMAGATLTLRAQLIGVPVPGGC
jgi:hypothetical protein